MSVMWAVIGAILGAMLGEAGGLGFIAGGLLGLLFGRTGGLSERVEQLEVALRREQGTRAAARVTPPAAATAAPSPSAPSPMPSAVDSSAAASPAAAERPEAAPVPDFAPQPARAQFEASEPRGQVGAEAVDPWAASAPKQPPPSRPAAPDPLDPLAPPPRPVIRPPGGGARINLPSEPGVIELGFGFVRRWFSEGNVPVKIGMLVLFFGVAALLKYAADQGMFSLPIELRLSAIAGSALAALWFAWGQREQRRSFALSLQGGALGVLLLTVFASYRLYDVLPATPAFAMVLLVVAASGLLAVLQNAMALAMLGSIGGFLAPVLLSTGSGSHVGLFSYYAVLNLAIFGIAWHKSWRPLNLVGFVFTFAIGSIWGARYYRPEFFSSTEPFLVLFFLLYVAIGYLFATRQPEARRGLVDGTLLFGTPLLAAGLQAGLLRDDDIALSISALAAAALYALLAWRTRASRELETLSLSYASLALGFATVAVPLALDADVTAQVWALEGAAVLWLGLRQQRNSQIVAGLLLQLIAILAWLVAVAEFGRGEGEVFINGVFVGGVLLSFALGCSALLLERSERSPPLALLGFFLMAGVWALLGGHEIYEFAASANQQHAALLWIALSLALASVLRMRLPWPRLGWLAIAGLLLSAPLAFGFGGSSALQGWGGWVWPLWLATALFALHALREPHARGLSWTHVVFLATLAMLVGNEAREWVAGWLPDGGAWILLALWAPLMLMLADSLREPPRIAFPLNDLFQRYRRRWVLPASLLLAMVWVLSLGHDGAADPLRYVTLLNPLELTQIGLLLLLYASAGRLGMDDAPRQLLAVVAGFGWITAVTLRGVHHYAGLPWDASLASSMLAQTSLTVVWSVLGVAAWIYGSKRGSRTVWLAGAVLMSVVLVKLMLVDRQHMGNIPGIVSFLAVGVLLTVVGYLAPSPPRDGAASPAEEPRA